MEKHSNDDLLISYLTLRKAIGYIGICLPFVLIIGGWILKVKGVESSMSSYYHTPMRDVFVGALCAMGIFFFSYRGYERKDSIAGNLACFFALGVAFFPTAREPGNPPIPITSSEQIISYIHVTFAALLFLTLAYFSLCLFTKSDAEEPEGAKLKRNLIYRICGWIMLAAIIMIPILNLLKKYAGISLEIFDPVFWLEAIAIAAFGVSWFTKGEGILGDKKRDEG